MAEVPAALASRALCQAVQEAELGGEVGAGWAAGEAAGRREEHCTESLEVLAHGPVASLAGGSGQVTPALCSWFFCLMDTLPGWLDQLAEGGGQCSANAHYNGFLLSWFPQCACLNVVLLWTY